MNREKDGIWTTRDGTEIHVTNIKDDHLVNIANMLIKIAKQMARQENWVYQENLVDYTEMFAHIDIYPHIDAELKKRELFVSGWPYIKDGDGC